jgi:hypothetical protein
MTERENALIAEATRALRIRDVMLNTCRFSRPTAPPADSDAVEVRQMTKRTVEYTLGDVPTDTGEPIKLLQVTVGLGIRVLATEGEPDKAPVYFEIEADFLVEYEVTKAVDDPAIRAFADYNSVHNVWPFWRQHVFDTVSRGRLPHLDVPLYSGSRSSRAKPDGTAPSERRAQKPARGRGKAK